jgi:hypothetical protein
MERRHAKWLRLAGILLIDRSWSSADMFILGSLYWFRMSRSFALPSVRTQLREPPAAAAATEQTARQADDKTVPDWCVLFPSLAKILGNRRAGPYWILVKC